MWHDTKEIVSESRTVPRYFSPYHLDHGYNPSNTSCDPWLRGQLGAGRLPYRRVCICVAHGKYCRLFSGTRLFKLLSRTITCTRELISICVCYPQGDGLSTSLSRLPYLVLYTILQLSSSPVCTLSLHGRYQVPYVLDAHDG